MNVGNKLKNELSLIFNGINSENTFVLLGWRVLEVLDILANYLSIGDQISSSIYHITDQHNLISSRVRKLERIFSRFKIVSKYSQRRLS